MGRFEQCAKANENRNGARHRNTNLAAVAQSVQKQKRDTNHRRCYSRTMPFVPAQENLFSSANETLEEPLRFDIVCGEGCAALPASFRLATLGLLCRLKCLPTVPSLRVP